jgi:hypothetical protein
MYYIFFVIKQKENKELSKDIFRVFQHKLSCHVPSVGCADQLYEADPDISANQLLC